MTDTDRALKLNRRKKTILLKSIESEVYKVVDELLVLPDGQSEITVVKQNELEGLLKTLTEYEQDLKVYSDTILDLVLEDDDAFEAEMTESTTVKIKLNTCKVKTRLNHRQLKLSRNRHLRTTRAQNLLNYP